MRDIQAVEAHLFGGSDQVGQRARGQSEPVEINELVQAAPAMRGGFVFVQCRRERGLNTRTDETQKKPGARLATGAVTDQYSRLSQARIS